MPSKEVFISKQSRPANGLDVKTLMSRKPVKGEVGIEIEVEGTKIPGVSGIKIPIPSPWMYHVDHSLRGPENGEFVLSKPINFDKVPLALTDLWECFKGNATKLNDSNRTSVHVHVNVQDWYLNRLCSFIALYYIVEIPLTEWCGEHRVGNLFCLRAIDAPAQVSNLKKFFQSNGETPIPEQLHYAALNTNALKKFGSIEIRNLRGCSDPTVILDWIETIERLYKLSEEFKDPRTICTSLSSIGPLAFFDEILGSKAPLIRKDSKMTDQEISEAVYEGVRIAQDICYSVDWDFYKPMKLKPDPFSRNQKTVAKKLQAASMSSVGSGYDFLSSAQPSYMAMDLASAATSTEPFPDPEPEYDDMNHYDEEED